MDGVPVAKRRPLYVAFDGGSDGTGGAMEHASGWRGSEGESSVETHARLCECRRIRCDCMHRRETSETRRKTASNAVWRQVRVLMATARRVECRGGSAIRW